MAGRAKRAAKLGAAVCRATNESNMTEILLAERSWSNESKGQDMYACLSDGGVVECYFPTKSAHDRKASLYAAAPDLLAALEAMLFATAKADGQIAKEARKIAVSAIAAAKGA